MKTLYELLGVSPDASDEALKVAYRKLAKMHHPDLNPNDPDAARRFREVTVAIAILCDAKRRSAYNQRLVRELQRGLDRERELRRRQWACIVAASAFAAVLIGIVVTNGSVLVEPVSSTSVVASGTTYDAVQQPVSVSTAQPESVSRGRPSDEIQLLPAVVPPPQTSTDSQDEVSMRSEQHCKHETGSTTYREGSGPARDVAGFEEGLRCELLKGREADERGLSANEKAALIWRAQELLASGDAKNAGVLLQRACPNSNSERLNLRCGSIASLWPSADPFRSIPINRHSDVRRHVSNVPTH
jgi:hypothetical protein